MPPGGDGEGGAPWAELQSVGAGHETIGLREDLDLGAKEKVG